MKRPGSGAIANFSFGLLFLSLVITAAVAAQQEVAPDHFDQSPGTVQPQKAFSHHKNTKKSQTRRAQKAVPTTAKLHSQKVTNTQAANTQTGQPVGK
jgi:hypothetical protein